MKIEEPQFLMKIWNTFWKIYQAHLSKLFLPVNRFSHKRNEFTIAQPINASTIFFKKKNLEKKTSWLLAWFWHDFAFKRMIVLQKASNELKACHK